VRKYRARKRHADATSVARDNGVTIA
jgi:hypothetical protein